MNTVVKNDSTNSVIKIHLLCLETILKQSNDSQNHGYENHTESYEIIQYEINKLKLSTPEKVEWDRVIKSGCKILTAGCEDLNIANYLVVALAAQYGSKMLVMGTQFLDNYVSSRWKTMRPMLSKNKLRARSVEWFYVNVFLIIKNDVSDYDADCAGKLYLILTNYADKLSILSSQKYIIPLNLSKILRSLMDAKIPNITSSNSNDGVISKPFRITRETEESTTCSSEINDDFPRKVQSNGDALLRQCQIHLNTFISLESESLQYEPNTFYFRRISAWLTIQEVPKFNNEFITQLQGPSEKDKARLTQEQNNSNQHGIISESEKILERYPLWLDANIITLKALHKLPENTDTIEFSILHLLKLLLVRFPKLNQCKFRNGEAMFSDQCSRYEHPVSPSIKRHTDVKSQTSSQNNKSILQLDENLNEFDTDNGHCNKQRQFTEYNNPRSYFKFHLEHIQNCMEENQYVLASAKISYLWQFVSNIAFRSWEADMAVSLSKLQIDAILALTESDSKLTNEDKLTCRRMYQFISGQNTYIASKIDAVRFFT